MIRILLNVALADHLAQELGSYLTLVGLMLELANASSELNELSFVGRCALLLEPLRLYVFFDLLLGPASLASCLHQVGRNAFCDYRGRVINGR